MTGQALIFKHTTPVQIRFTDIDMMQHVTNSMYFSYCDIARITYFNEVLEEKIGQSSESLVIASVTIDFLNPIFMDENIVIHTRTVKIGNKSIHTLQRIININSGQEKAIVRTVLSGFDYVQQQPIVIPQKWKDKLNAFDTGIEIKTTQQ